MDDTETMEIPNYALMRRFMVRTPARPLYTGNTAVPDSHLREPIEDVARSFVDDPQLNAALRIASPSAHDALTQARAADGGFGLTPALARTLRKYWIRLHSRPTPFGLFSAVGLGTFGESVGLTVEKTAIESVHVRPDLGWLAALIDTWKDRGAAGTHPSRVNHYLATSGGRYVVAHSNVLGEKENNRVDFRATAPVELAIKLAKQGLSRAQIEDELIGAYPDVPADVPRKMLDDLYEQHVLVDHPMPSLRWDTDLTAIFEAFERETGERPVYNDSNQLETLRWIDKTLRSIGTTEDFERESPQVVKCMQELVPDHRGDKVTVEASLSRSPRMLPSALRRQVEELGSTLMLLGPGYARRPHLVDYEAAFIEQFGAFAEVPLLNVLDPESGLGAPETYSAPVSTRSFNRVMPLENRRREELILRWLNLALARGDDEIELDDARLKELTEAGNVAGAEFPPSIDLFLEIMGTPSELEDGSADLVFRGTVADGARAYGRFSQQLGDEAREQIRKVFEQEAAATPNETLVQLNYFPNQAKAANVARTDPVAELEISINCNPTLGHSAQVNLEEILVGASGNGLYLRWSRTGQRIRIVQNHMLNPFNAPNPIRFLLEVSNDGVALGGFFDWGIAHQAPRLPRVRRGTYVLSPAKWTVQSSTFGDEVLYDAVAFEREFNRHRAAVGMPESVFLTENDNRLLLDLERPEDLELVRDELTRGTTKHNQILLEETLIAAQRLPAGTENGERYTSEFVFTLVLDKHTKTSGGANEHGASGESTKRLLTARSTTSTAHGLNRDVSWLSFELFGATRSLDQIITELPRAVVDIAGVRRWFFIRYSSDGNHLRIRLQPEPGQYSEVLVKATQWMNHLVDTGSAIRYRLVDYHPEINRYGGLECMSAAFDVFESDSVFAAKLTELRNRLPGFEDDVIATHLLDSTYRACGLLQDVLGDLGEAPSRHPARSRFREVRRQIGSLLEPEGKDASADGATFLFALEGSRRLYENRLLAYMDTVNTAAREERTIMAPREIAHSVAHMHLNRSLGISSEDETLSYALLSVAHRALARRKRALGGTDD